MYKLTTIRLAVPLVLAGLLLLVGGSTAQIVNTLEAKLTAQSTISTSDIEAGAQFGHSVSLDGDRALIGAPRKDENSESGAGAAYIYAWDGAAWIFEAKLTAQSAPNTSDIEAGAQFGSSVSLDGGRALIGSIGKNENGGNFAGAAYIYAWDGTSWTFQAKLTAQSAPGTPDVEANADFGSSVSLDGDRVLIGSAGKDEDSLMASGAGLYLCVGWHVMDI